MARNPDIELRSRVLEFIKREFMKAGNKPISLSLATIARGIGEKPEYAEKIMRMVNALERMGSLEISHGEGSRSNIYTFKNDGYKTLVNEIKEEVTTSFDEKLFDVNRTIGDLVEYFSIINKKYIDVLGLNGYYKEALLELELNGYSTDGTPLFKTKTRYSTLPQVIEKLQSELEIENNQEETTIPNSEE